MIDSRNVHYTTTQVAILLAAAEFERCIKRGILALGRSPTKEIKETIFNGRFHGLDAFKK